MCVREGVCTKVYVIVYMFMNVYLRQQPKLLLLHMAMIAHLILQFHAAV